MVRREVADQRLPEVVHQRHPYHRRRIQLREVILRDQQSQERHAERMLRNALAARFRDADPQPSLPEELLELMHYLTARPP